MRSIDPEKIKMEHLNGKNLIPEVEALIDKFAVSDYTSIFFIGIGGTEFYARQMAYFVKERKSLLPLHIENAADFCEVGNPFLNSHSIVFFESISGDTKELIEAIKIVRSLGAKVIGYVEAINSPLANLCDHLLTTIGAGYYFWYTLTFRLLNKRGEFPEYKQFIEDLEKIPELVDSIQNEIDQEAQSFASNYGDEPIHYVIGSGSLEDWAMCYSTCILEEMIWIKTRPVSASNFFHGTLEVIDRDISVLLIKGEDYTRPLAERVERFVSRVSNKLTVIDSKDFTLNGISTESRKLLGPIVIRTAFQVISSYLEEFRKHPLAIRRYYRSLDY